ncbi:MAG: hypothetical protein NZ483_00370 [Verrucomicrobiae bacterium]|nr:hypothetical protein [Verrucomicrobiae bacterium]MDW8343046.1 hypothetical protein [Verrucomicrobiae bacterium]
MIGRFASGFVVVFWAGMMLTLVRTEFFPHPTGVSEVPLELVLRKMFNNTESPGLSVNYRGQSLGFFKVDFTPIHEGGEARGADRTGGTVEGYQVQSELNFLLPGSNKSNRLRVVSQSRFDPQYELQTLRLRTTFAEGVVEVQGDKASNRLVVDFEFANYRERREFEFDRFVGSGIAGAMGLPGMSGLGLLGGGASGVVAGLNASTRCYLSDLPVGDTRLKTYLVDYRIDDSLWAKMWVSLRGELLKVETSLGLTMQQEPLLLSDRL